MNVRATIGLTIDIDADKDMGLEILDEDIPNYAREELVEYLYDLLKSDDIYDVIQVEVINE